VPRWVRLLLRDRIRSAAAIGGSVGSGALHTPLRWDRSPLSFGPVWGRVWPPARRFDL